MKWLLILALISVVACSKEKNKPESFQERQEGEGRPHCGGTNKLDCGYRPNSVMTILSRKPLPNKIKLLINGRQVWDECRYSPAPDYFSVQRNARNGIITLNHFWFETRIALAVEINDCTNNGYFYSHHNLNFEISPRQDSNSLQRVLVKLEN